MKDSQQMSVEIGVQNSMALKALPPVTVKDSSLFPMENIADDEMSDESFHLHLSEDEDDEKTEKKQEVTKTSGVSSDVPTETEDDILDKFVAAENTALENVDDKLEEKLLNDADEDGDADKCDEKATDKPTSDSEKSKDEAETKLPNGDCEDSSKAEDDTSASTAGPDVVSVKETVVDKDKADSDEMCVDTDVCNDQKQSEESEKFEPSSQEAESSAATEDSAKQEKVNAEILKDQVMDTEDLLQIVEKDTEENNDKDSSSGNSPRSVDKAESSEDTEMDCNDIEPEKIDEDEESETDKGIAKEEDGVDIEEENTFKDDFDSELNKEYEKMAESKDFDEDKSSEEKTDEAADSSTVKSGKIDEVKDIPLTEASLNEDVAMETTTSEEDSNKKSDDEKDDATTDVAASDKTKDLVSAVNLSPELESTTTEKSKDDDADATTTDTSSKSSKRSLCDVDLTSDAKKLKLQKNDSDLLPASKESSVEDKTKKSEEPAAPDYDEITPCAKIVALNAVSEYMQNKKLEKLSRNDLEQICLMKMCEAICHKSEIGELRHQLGVQEQMVEMWRKEAAQLTKQARDLEIVNKRLLHEVRLKNERDKPLIPVKITRSVGLQVRSDNNMINNVVTPKRRLNRPQPTNTIAPAKQNRFIQSRANTVTKVTTPNKVVTTPNKVVTTPNKVVTTPNKVVTAPNKVISTSAKMVTSTPSKAKVMTSKSPSSLLSQALQNSAAQAAAATATTTAAASLPSLVPTAATLTSTISTTPILVSAPTTLTTPVPTSAPIANKTVTNSSPKTSTKSAVDSKTFIDLTDEDDKKPIALANPTPTTLTTSTTQGVRIVSTPVKTGNVVSTAGVVNPPRIMYVYNNQLHQGVLAADPTKPGAQKLMLKLNSNVIGPPNGVLTAVPNGSAIAVGNTALRAGQVQPVRLSSPVNAARNAAATAKTVLKHPAPLPPPPASQLCLPARKPIPPKPHLSIRRSSGGIVLSWKMPYNLDNFESIASYQLYAYQETTSPPSSDMWRKVGDVKALALPMACTLTQFADGNKYHFAVRAVDVQKRMGPFSDPEQILL